MYEKSYRRYAAFTQDERGRYWLRVAHDGSACDDCQQVFLPVRNEREAEDIYAKVGAVKRIVPSDFPKRSVGIVRKTGMTQTR